MNRKAAAIHTRRGFDENRFLFVTRQIVTPDGVRRATEHVLSGFSRTCGLPQDVST